MNPALVSQTGVEEGGQAGEEEGRNTNREAELGGNPRFFCFFFLLLLLLSVRPAK